MEDNPADFRGCEKRTETHRIMAESACRVTMMLSLIIVILGARKAQGLSELSVTISPFRNIELGLLSWSLSFWRPESPSGLTS